MQPPKNLLNGNWDSQRPWIILDRLTDEILTLCTYKRIDIAKLKGDGDGGVKVQFSGDLASLAVRFVRANYKKESGVYKLISNANYPQSYHSNFPIFSHSLAQAPYDT